MSDMDYEIYVITTDQYWYVGSAAGKNPYASRRFEDHMRGNKTGVLLRPVVKTLGRDAFSQEVLESGHGDVLAAERRWYDYYLVNDNRECLNGKRPDEFDGCMRGKPHTPEHNQKISESLKGQPCSPERAAKISAANTGKKPTAELRPKTCWSLRNASADVRTLFQIWPNTSRRQDTGH